MLQRLLLIPATGAEIGGRRTVAAHRRGDEEELGVVRNGSVRLTHYPDPQRLPQVRRRIGKTGMRIDVMFGLENVDGRTVRLEHHVIERLDADANAITLGQTTQRLKQRVSALIEVAQRR